MNFAGVEFHDYPLVRKIDNNVEDPGNFHQDRSQLAHAFVAIFAFGRDLDLFDNRVIGPLRIKRIARLRFVWSRRVHQLRNVRRGLSGRNFARDRFENAPDIFRENLLPGRIWMHMVRLI
jgi:hypothetical protein